MRRRQGGAARQAALQHFSLRSMVQQYQDVYDRVRAGAPRQAAANA
jgi:hypothetical protein